MTLNDEIHLLRKRWGIPTVKINGTEPNPPRWPDGTYSIQGVAEVLEITPQTVFDWPAKGRFTGSQLVKGMPWKITLSNQQITDLKAQVRYTQGVQGKGHREVIGSPITTCHLSIGSWLVMTVERRHAAANTP